MAPTKPLVAQQIEACFRIMGFGQEDMTEITGERCAMCACLPTEQQDKRAQLLARSSGKQREYSSSPLKCDIISAMV
jgi:hypothetical protein